MHHPATPHLRRTDNRLGIGYMVLAMLLMASVDAQTKYLSQTLPVLQVAWFRQLGLLVGVLAIIGMRGLAVLETRRPGLQVLRGALAVCSAVSFILAISYVPLVDAAAVTFVAPLVVTVMGAVLLKEPVGIRRWAAALVGFAGAMIVLRPGLGVVHPAALFALGAAFMFASRQVLSRVLADSDSTPTTLAYTALTGSALLTLPLPFIWQTPQTALELALLASIGVLAGFGELCVIKSLEVGEAVAVAPMQYTTLLWTTGFGWLLFADLPDLWTTVGALIVVASGLYTFHRERKRSGAPAISAPTARSRPGSRP